MGQEKPKKRIEMICMGNQGRSPVAELVARNYIVSLGADEFFYVASSGTLVESINTKKVSLDNKIYTINKAIEMGENGSGNVFSRSNRRLAEESIASKHTQAIDYFFEIAAEAVNAHEVANRAAAIKYFKIPGRVKRVPEPTVAQRDASALFTMSAGNLEAVKGIYAGAGMQIPLLDVLSRYAWDSPKAELPDAYGKPKGVYLTMVQQLLLDVPRAMDRLLMEHP
jgi:protein-tyrosine-phosphatase